MEIGCFGVFPKKIILKLKSNMIIPFVKYSKLWIIISAITALLSIFFLFKFGLKPGIEFTGGSLLELSFSNNRPAISEIQKVLETSEMKSAVVQGADEKGYIIRGVFLNENQHQELLKSFRDNFEKEDNKVIEERFETIGPAISQQLKQRASWAVIFVNLGIIAYVAYAFRKVSKPVASWKYGVLAIIALIHDVLLVMGVFAILGHYKAVEVDIAFVVALLTVLGYSVNDTIVVYDRIRENLQRHRGADDFSATVNKGLNETLIRSINTTATTLLPLFVLFFIGGASIHNFTLALLIGIASGAYSSIFIASPLLVLVEKWQRR